MNVPRKTILIVLAFFAVYVIWGSTYMLNKIAVAEISPIILAAIRFITAGILILVIAEIMKISLSMWPQHLFNGNAVSTASREKMLTFLGLANPIANGYGLGIRRVFLAGRNTWGHTEGMRGYGSYMCYDPSTNVSIAL